MGTFKVDDKFYSCPQAVSSGLAAIGLWTIAGSWSIQYQTFGFIPEGALRALGGSRELAERLVETGLWESVDGGWKFVRWRKYQDGGYRRNIPAAVRAEVLSRDGYKCVACGSPDRLSMDHIVRYRDDGPDTAENLRVLCMPCNLERG